MKRYAFLILSGLLLSGILHAAEPKAVLSLDRRDVSPGKQAKMTLKVEGAVPVKIPEPPFVNGLDIRYQDTVNTGIDSAVFVYRIVAKKTGNYTIGPVYIEYQGGRTASNVVSLTVAKEAYAVPYMSASDDMDLSGRIYLSLDLPKKRLYVNERLPVEIKLFSDWFDLEDITINEIVTGEILAEKLSKGNSDVVNIGDKRFAVMSYKTNIIAPVPGKATIEPVKVSLNVAPRKPGPSGELPSLLNDNEAFYKNYIAGRNKVPIELETEPIQLEILPLPLKNRPDTFGGAVGNFNFDAEASPLRVKAGDEVKIRLSVTGDGNYSTFSTINIPAIPGTKPYEPIVKRGSDSFTMEETVRVVSTDVDEIPVITFSFFDPAKADYVSISRGPFRIISEVASLKKISAGTRQTDAASKAEEAPKPKAKKPESGIIELKASMGRTGRFDPYLYSGAIPFAFQAIPLLLVFAAILVKNRMNFLESDHEYAAWMRMLKRSDYDIARAERLFRQRRVKEFYDHVFKFMQAYLGARLMVPAEGITEKTAGDILQDKINDAKLLSRVNRIFGDCYIARFTSIELSDEDMKDSLDDLKHVINYLNGKTYLLNI